MLNSEKILAALKAFDPTNAGYWTEDGLPILEAVQHLAGDLTITREMVTAVAPGFTRVNPSLDVAVVTTEATKPVEPASLGPTIAPTPQEKPPVQTPPEQHVVNKSTGEVYQDELTQVRNKMAELKDEMAWIDGQKSELQKRQDVLAQAEEVLDRKLRSLEKGDKTMQALAQYRASQTAMLELRREKISFVKEHMETLGPILKTKAPIDAAFARKNSRGMQRPGG